MLEADPYRARPGFACKKLGGYEDVWRFKVGDWRVSYAIDDNVRVVSITKVGPRPNFYD